MIDETTILVACEDTCDHAIGHKDTFYLSTWVVDIIHNMWPSFLEQTENVGHDTWMVWHDIVLDGMTWHCLRLVSHALSWLLNFLVIGSCDSECPGQDCLINAVG